MTGFHSRVSPKTFDVSQCSIPPCSIDRIRSLLIGPHMLKPQVTAMFVDRKSLDFIGALIETIPRPIECTNAKAERLNIGFYFDRTSVLVLVLVNWPKAPKTPSFVPVTKNFPIP